MGRLTVNQLAAISQNPDPVTYDLKGDVEALVPEMVKAGITTKRRVAAFLANVSQETDRLNTLEEYGEERYFRSFLGDQWRYHGRGYIMNTWRDAYERLSRVLGVDLVRDPDKLANNKNLAARAAIWFWEKGNVTGESINRYADQGNFKAVCSIINRGQVKPQGPINGWDMRVHFHQRALNILPDGFTLDAGE
jgi:predicted chitinase